MDVSISELNILAYYFYNIYNLNEISKKFNIPNTTLMNLIDNFKNDMTLNIIK